MKKKVRGTFTYGWDRLIALWLDLIGRSWGIFNYGLCIAILPYTVTIFLILLPIRIFGDIFRHWDQDGILILLLISMGLAFPVMLTVDGLFFWDFKKDKAKCYICWGRGIYRWYHGLDEDAVILIEETKTRRQFYYDRFHQSQCEVCRSIYYQQARGKKLAEQFEGD